MNDTSGAQTTLPGRLLVYARQRIAIDTRTLAVFRIGVGMLVLADLISRSTRFVEYYTEAGIFSQALAHEYAEGWVFSLFFLSDSPYLAGFLFVLQALVALQFIVGYRTRIATVLLFLLVSSLHVRNPLVLNSGDSLLRLLLFWAMFLPMGERWSVDAVHRARAPRPEISSMASTAILLQVTFMYVGNAIHKVVGDAWLEGNATPVVFGLDQLMWLLTPYVQGFPGLLSVAGWIWFGMLALVSWQLILAPGRIRTLIACAFILVHVSFALTMRIGIFPFVTIFGVGLFLQASFWEDLRRFAPSRTIRLLEHTRRRLTDAAGSLPRAPLPELLPPRVTSAGHYAIIVVAVAGVLVMPPLGFLSNHGILGVDISVVNRPISAVTRTFAVEQPAWRMFAPNPLSRARYYVFAAEQEDGGTLDVFGNRALTYDRPPGKLYEQFPHYRDRKYMTRIAFATKDATTVARGELAEFLCSTQERQNGVRLRQIDMYVISEQVTPETISDHTGRERTAELFYQHACYGRVAGEVSPPDLPAPEPIQATHRDSE